MRRSKVKINTALVTSNAAHGSVDVVGGALEKRGIDD